jgi:hypothetical protein
VQTSFTSSSPAQADLILIVRTAASWLRPSVTPTARSIGCGMTTSGKDGKDSPKRRRDSDSSCTSAASQTYLRVLCLCPLAPSNVDAALVDQARADFFLPAARTYCIINSTGVDQVSASLRTLAEVRTLGEFPCEPFLFRVGSSVPALISGSPAQRLKRLSTRHSAGASASPNCTSGSNPAVRSTLTGGIDAYD